jgi:RimJ/RimL family protein N-acetyltransferase
MPPTELLTPRLRLTPFTREDFDEFFEACVLDPAVIHYWWAYGQPGLTVEDKRQMAIEDFVLPAEQGLRDLGLVVWTARLRDATLGPEGDFVGMAGVVPPEMPSQGSEPDLGYLLAARYQGLGLATEAGRAVVADAFERYRLERLAALVDEPNIGSSRVLEKIGFRQVLRWVGEDGNPMLRFLIERSDLEAAGRG